MDLVLHEMDLQPVSFWIGVENWKYASFLQKKKKKTAAGHKRKTFLPWDNC